MDDPIQRCLRSDDDELNAEWQRVLSWIEHRFGRQAGIEAVLFLIGLQSRGIGYEPEMEKERKQDTIMEGTFCAFEKLGFYERIGVDEHGFWIWERSVESIPKLSIEDQEKILKLGIVRYFDDVIGSASQARP